MRDKAESVEYLNGLAERLKTVEDEDAYEELWRLNLLSLVRLAALWQDSEFSPLALRTLEARLVERQVRATRYLVWATAGLVLVTAALVLASIQPDSLDTVESQLDGISSTLDTILTLMAR